MTSTLRDICFDCTDQARVATFWRDVLGYDMSPENIPEGYDDSVSLRAPTGGIRIWFSPVPEPKVAKNRLHIDVNMLDQAEFDRLLSLGATKVGEIRGENGALFWTVMADPEGNEFCAFPPPA